MSLELEVHKSDISELAGRKVRLKAESREMTTFAQLGGRAPAPALRGGRRKGQRGADTGRETMWVHRQG